MGRQKQKHSEHTERLAWARLSPTDRAAWLEFVRLHNGANNGRLAMPSRTLGKRLGVHKTTAERSINSLITFGFLTRTRGGGLFPGNGS